MRFLFFAASLIVLAPSPATAQFKLPSSLGGMGLPGIGNAGVGNVAGLLGYCIKNKLSGGAGAQSVLGKLTGQPTVTQSPGFAQGQLGQVLGGGQSGAKPTLSLDSLGGQMKTKACDLVLKRAGSFL